MLTVKLVNDDGVENPVGATIVIFAWPEESSVTGIPTNCVPGATETDDGTVILPAGPFVKGMLTAAPPARVPKPVG